MLETFVFAGNRTMILDFMIKKGLNVKWILVVKNSHLQIYVEQNQIENYSVIENKDDLIQKIQDLNFDYFIANGLPYILPISTLSNGNKKFINIHPSYLPDLRGADPVPGAILFKRDSGATCHYMNDGIDTGDIISQIKIPYHENYDIGLLYQLCFNAEVKVFSEALDNKFNTSFIQEKKEGDIYYSYKYEDLIAKQSDSVDKLLNRIRAFSNPSKGVRILLDDQTIKVFSAEKLNSDIFHELGLSNNQNQIIFSYEDKLIIKWKNSYLKVNKYLKVSE